MWWRKERTASPLDDRLLHWTDHDPFSVRDLLDGGLLVLGRSGSGKSSGSGQAVSDALIAYPRSGGLILASKPEDKAAFTRLFERHQRLADLHVVEPGGKWQCNFLASELSHGGHTRNVVRCMTTISESLANGAESGGREGDEFWKKSEERYLFNAVEIMKHATGQVRAPELQRFIATAAYKRDDLASDRWQADYHNQCLRAAYERTKSLADTHDCNAAIEFWTHEFVTTDERPRSSILAGVNNLLHTFNTGIVREMVSQDTTLSPEVTLTGKWVLVNMPPAEYRDLGKLVNSGWKFLTQQAVLRRTAKPGDPIHVIWCDEAQEHVTSMDVPYLAQCRSHLGCMVYLSQSLSAFHSALGGKRGETYTKALLANFGHKMAHALGDPESARFFSELVGDERRSFIGGSNSMNEGVYDQLFGDPQASSSFSEQYTPVLQPRLFMHGLRTGGEANDRIVDGVLVRSGRPFSTGENHLHVSFKQEAS